MLFVDIGGHRKCPDVVKHETMYIFGEMMKIKASCVSYPYVNILPVSTVHLSCQILIRIAVPVVIRSVSVHSIVSAGRLLTTSWIHHRTRGIDGSTAVVVPRNPYPLPEGLPPPFNRVFVVQFSVGCRLLVLCMLTLICVMRL